MKAPASGIFLLFCHLSAVSQVNLTSSLTACYALDGNAAEPVNSLTGTLSAVSATVDRFNTSASALEFAGTPSSIVRLPNSVLLKPAAVTVSGWYRASLLPSSMMLVFAKNIYFSYFTAYSLCIQDLANGHRFTVYRQNGSGNNFVTSTTTVSANSWYHVTFSIDQSNMRLYVNGVLEQTLAATITAFNYDSTREVILGGSNELNFNEPYSGSIDNLRFYNRVLNAAEVSALYSQDPFCGIPTPPVTGFSASTLQLCAGNSLTLTDQSTNNPTSWNWQISGSSTFSSSLTNPVISFPNPGIHFITLNTSNGAGPGNSVTQTIVVHPNPTVNVVSSQVPVCLGSSVSLQASGAPSYSWNGQAGPSSMTIYPQSNVTFTVTGIDANGCTASAVFVQPVAVPPAVTVTANPPVSCAGSGVTLTAAGAASYTWSTAQTGPQIVVSLNNSSTFSVIGTDGSGCTGVVFHQQTVYPSPQITIIGPLQNCAGSSIALLAAGAQSYTWSTSHTSSSISVAPASNTVYAVTGTAINGCQNSASVNIVSMVCPGLDINTPVTPVRIFPNPFTNLVHAAVDAPGKFTLTDLQGRLIFEKSVQNSMTLEFPALAEGVYLLFFESSAGTFTTKLVRQ
jgi:PKD repeat protein